MQPAPAAYSGVVIRTGTRGMRRRPGAACMALGARSAATLRRDPVRCPGTPTVSGERVLEPRLGVIDEPLANPDRLPRRRRHTRSAAAAVEPADDRLVGHTRRPGRGLSPPISRKIVRCQRRVTPPGTPRYNRPVIQLPDPEPAGHGGDVDGGSGHLRRRRRAATISGVPITSDASNDSRCHRRETSACGSADPGPGQAATSRRAAPLPDRWPTWQ